MNLYTLSLILTLVVVFGSLFWLLVTKIRGRSRVINRMYSIDKDYRDVEADPESTNVQREEVDVRWTDFKTETHDTLGEPKSSMK